MRFGIRSVRWAISGRVLMIGVSIVFGARHFPSRRATVCDCHRGDPPEGCGQSNKKVKDLPKKDKWCAHCFYLGYKNKPQKVGELCSICLAENVTLSKSCVECGQNKRKCKGGVCRSCYNKRCAKEGASK